MKALRKIAFLPLFLALGIIIVHSIVPHHHHTHERAHCHSCEEGYHFSVPSSSLEVSERDGEGHFVCHFHVEAFAYLSLDIHFLPPLTDKLLPLAEIVIRATTVDNPLKVEALYLTNNQLRAPPAAV